nr:tetratricopeptide repeat protein 25-like [Osmia lignaria]
MAVLASENLASELVDLNETRKAVENAENRARLVQRKSDLKIGRRNNREYAQALHREADKLYRSGDYETALVLYHRAANLFPRDSSHSVAARRTSATISSCNNPSKALRKALPSVNNGERLTVSLCPETAAILANDRLKKSPNPTSVAEILSYFDAHKTLWKTLPSPRPFNALARNKSMLRKQQLADQSLTNLRTAFDSGKMTAALKIAQELLLLSAGFQDPTRYQIAAYHYLSLIHVALHRHDRAVSNVARLVRLCKSTGDQSQIYKSFVTLGKVHLSFGHLEAAAKSWEHLSKDLKEPIPVAWIRHEIGRCYLETGKYNQAMEMAVECVDAAVKGKSKKWLLYGKLLLGVSLAKLGRFVEAVEELQVAGKITEEEGDTPMLSYIRNLIDQVAHALQSNPFGSDQFKQPTAASSRDEQPRRSGMFVSREQTVITTMFTQRMITEYHDDSASDRSLDEEITMRSENTTSPVKSHQESQEPSVPNEDELPRGDITFRKASFSEEQDHSSSSSTSSSSFSTDKLREVEEDEEEEISEDVQDEEGLRCTSSKTSFKSANTTATYVIEGGDSKVEKEEEKGTVGMIDEACKSEGSKSDQDLENGLFSEVIDRLDKMEHVELVRLLQKELLEEDWSDDFRDSGDADREKSRTPRSCQDSKNKILTNH